VSISDSITWRAVKLGKRVKYGSGACATFYCPETVGKLIVSISVEPQRRRLRRRSGRLDHPSDRTRDR
jgi:hypothetical protein